MADKGTRKRTQARIKTTSLQEVVQDLMGVQEVPSVLYQIAEMVRSAAGAESVYLEHLDPERDEVEVLAVAGEPEEAVGTRMPYPNSLARQVLEQDGPAVVRPEELERRPIVSALSDRCRKCPVLVLPLVFEARPLGALLLFRDPEKPAYSPESIFRLRVMADMAALTIHRILLQEQAAIRIRNLERSERSFRLLVQGVKDYAIFMLDPQGRIVSWNEGAERIKGYSADEILGEHFSRFYTEHDRARGHPQEELRIALQEGHYEEEGWRVRKDGSHLWAHVTITAIYDESGAHIGFSKVTRDLTERRRHERELRDLLRREQTAHQEVSNILERITDAFFALDRDWRFTYMNAATREVARSLLDRDPDEMFGESFWDVVWQLRETRFEEEYRRAMRTQTPAHFIEYSEVFRVWFNVHLYPSPEGLSVYFRDVTRQRRMEETLETERQRLRAVLDALPVGVFISDAHGKILEANRAAQAIWGGRTPLVEDPREYGAYSAWWLETGARVESEDWPLTQALRTGESVSGVELEVESFDGARKTLLVYALPIRDAKGEVTGGVGVNVDVTDRQRLLREAQTARVDAERANRAKSEFLATMSHEIRTPINAIMGYTELLEMGLAGPVNQAQRAQLERVRSSSTHLLGLINDILDLAKVEAGRMSVATGRAVAQHAISAALALVSPQAAERGIQVRNECGGKTSIVYCGDEDRVRQILVNLLSNAVKFTDSSGTVTLRCGKTSEPGAGTSLSGKGTWAYIEVEDTGVGIRSEQMEEVFQPFVQADQTSTRTRGGTGLGLTISRELARLMGGDLTGRSEIGKGSVFTLWLPGEEIGPRKTSEEETGPRWEVMVQVGRTVLDQVQPIMESLTGRIRQDSSLPDTEGLSDADLQDHGVALLSDIAQSLVALEDSEIEPAALLRDGGEIQRVISELHGAQRARLGWSEEHLHREFQIFREEVKRAVHDSLLAVPEDELTDALEVLTRCLDNSERISRKAMQGTYDTRDS